MDSETTWLCIPPRTITEWRSVSSLALSAVNQATPDAPGLRLRTPTGCRCCRCLLFLVLQPRDGVCRSRILLLFDSTDACRSIDFFNDKRKSGETWCSLLLHEQQALVCPSVALRGLRMSLEKLKQPGRKLLLYRLPLRANLQSQHKKQLQREKSQIGAYA